MCGRYEILPSQESEELFDIINAANKKYGNASHTLAKGIDKGSASYKTGEIFPSDTVPILTAGSTGNSMSVNIFDWGFNNFKNDGLLINARSETITEKPTFKDSFAERRCVIPSTGFYEWTHNPDERKTKYLFNCEDTGALYMAGIWKMYGDRPKFVILTTDANDSISDVHDRMPVILKRAHLREWLTSQSSALDLLKERTPELIRKKAN